MASLTSHKRAFGGDTTRCGGPTLRARGSRRAAVVARGSVANHNVLVGDIGGTNARLSVWQAGPKKEEIFAKIYPTSSYDTFEEVVDEFLKEPEVACKPPEAAALAVAGAVEFNRCAMTNINWIVDGPGLEKNHNFKVRVLNDFEAVGYGIPALEQGDIVPVNMALEKPMAPKVVMGPGTGLGAAQLMWDGLQRGYKVWPGEGSHATFAPRGWKQTALSDYVTQKYGHCEIEQVACGSGLALIYEFLLTDEVGNRPDVLRNGSPKQPPEVASGALDGSDPLAVEAVDMFLNIIGAEAGAMALRCLAGGGVYIAGGITPKLMKRVQHGALRDGFLMARGREKFHNILIKTPLYVITNDSVGKIGACEVALKLSTDK
uniref:Glucokinase n=1 Tax=Chlamydomonas euryale TaxID=1486919 RepID=A0A7R9V6T2_9CHLO